MIGGMLYVVGNTYDRVVVSRANMLVYGLDGREVTRMTVFEIITIVLRMISLLISLGSLLIALLTFLESRNKHK